MPRTKKQSSKHANMLPFFLGGAVIVLAAIYVLLQFLGGGPQPLSFYGGKDSSMAQRSVAIEEVGFRGDMIVADGGGATSVEDRQVVRTGHLSVVVLRAEEAVNDITDISERFGGFVSNVYVTEIDNNVKRGSVTIRVPADRFDTAMEEIKSLALQIESEQVDARDVTEQVVDLEARLSNLRASEEQLVLLLEETGSVEELLAVQRELNSVRGQIERLEAQLQNLEEQVEMATISVSLTSEADVKIFGVIWNPLNEVKQALRMLLEDLVGFVNFLIAFVFYLPVLLLWVVFAGAILFGGWKGFYLLSAHAGKKKKK